MTQVSLFTSLSSSVYLVLISLPVIFYILSQPIIGEFLCGPDGFNHSFYMCVVTFCFQNFAQYLVYVQWVGNGGFSFGTPVFTGPVSVHFQTIGVQSLAQHKVGYSTSIKKNRVVYSRDDLRVTFTMRSTGRFQTSGKVNLENLSGRKLTAYPGAAHRLTTNLFGARADFERLGNAYYSATGTNNGDNDDDGIDEQEEIPGLPAFEEDSDDGDNDDANDDASLPDLRWEQRPPALSDPKLPSNTVRIPQSLATSFASGPFMERFAQKKIKLEINCTAKGSTAPTRHKVGPVWASDGKPLPLGSILERSEVGRVTDLPTGDYNRPWSTEMETLFSLHVTHRYKNDNDGLLKEYRRLQEDNAKDLREPVWICMSGGAATYSGACHMADPSRPTVGESGILESSQDHTTKLNAALLSSCEQRRVINLYAALNDELFPGERNPGSTSTDAPKSVYMGAFVMHAALLSSVPLDQLQSAVTNLVDYRIQNLSRFESEPHYKVLLVPFLHPAANESTDNWRTIVVDDSNQDQVITGVIPRDVSFGKAFSISPKPNDIGNLHIPYTRQNVIDEFFNDEQPNAPYLGFLEDGEEDKIDTICPSPFKKWATPEEFMSLFACLSVASYLRMLRVHVDEASNTIGPLVFPNADDEFGLDNIAIVLGDDNLEIKACFDEMGIYCQGKAMPFPIRTYDIGTLLFIISCGGQNVRCGSFGSKHMAENPMLAADRLMMAIVNRCTGDPASMEYWARQQQKKSGESIVFLPAVDQVPSFLHSMKRLLSRTSKNSSSKSSRRILSKHIYNSLPGEFKSFPALSGLISHWSHRVLAFISSCVMEGAAEQPEEGVDRRKWLMDRMVAIFTEGGVQRVTSGLLLVVAHIVCDMDEVYDGFPFGEPNKSNIILGPGAVAGLQAVRLDEAKASNIDKLAYFLHLHNTAADEVLCMLGCERRVDESFARVKLTGRPLDLQMMEHPPCKIHKYIEQVPGGSRSFGNTPERQPTYCHPAKLKDADLFINFAGPTATQAICSFQTYRKSVDWLPLSYLLKHGTLEQGDAPYIGSSSIQQTCGVSAIPHYNRDNASLCKLLPSTQDSLCNQSTQPTATKMMETAVVKKTKPNPTKPTAAEMTTDEAKPTAAEMTTDEAKPTATAAEMMAVETTAEETADDATLGTSQGEPIDCDDERSVPVENHLSTSFDMATILAIIGKLGTLVDVLPNGNCGYLAVQMGLESLGLLQGGDHTLTMTNLRKQLYNHALANQSELYYSTGSTAENFPSVVLNKIFIPSIETFDQGCTRDLWMNSSLVCPIFVHMFGVSIVVYHPREGEQYRSSTTTYQPDSNGMPEAILAWDTITDTLRPPENESAICLYLYDYHYQYIRRDLK
jgi:hypothetical protein